MTRLFKILLVLALVVTGVHYLAWSFMVNKAESVLISMLKQAEETSNAQVEYRISKNGYPLHMGLTLHELSIVTRQGEDKFRFSLGPQSEVTFLASIFNPLSFEGDVSNVTFNVLFTGPQLGDADLGVDITQGHIAYRGKKEDHEIETAFEQVKIQGIPLAQGQKVSLTVDSLSSLQKTVETSGGLIDSNVSMNLEGLRIPLPEEMALEAGVDVFQIDKYSIQLTGSRLPQNITELQKGLQEVSTAMQQQNTEVDMRDFKGSLRSLVEQMAENNSRLSLDSLNFEINNLPKGRFAFQANGDLTINEEYKPQGAFSVSIDGLAGLLDVAPEAQEPNDLNALMLGGMQQGPFSLNFAANEGFLQMNGIPVMPAPTLTDLIESIPDFIETPPATE